GFVIDSLTYSENMYGNEIPSGGISLERIDLQNTCGIYSNWRAAKDSLGGTPGFTNSVANEPVEKFAINSVYAVSKKNLLLKLTDVPDTLNSLPNFALSTDSEAINFTKQIIGNIIYFELENEISANKTCELAISNLSGKCNAINDTTLQINSPKVYDLIFTEIRFKSTNKVDLPNTDYLEIYNRSNQAIQTAGMQLQIGDKKYNLPNVRIETGEYWTISHATYAEKFKKLGKTIVLNNFPDLGNTSGTLLLLDAGGSILANLAYTSDFFEDKFYYELGYSLELFDVNSPASLPENWHESKNSIGGTPGTQNSVATANPDKTLPQITRIGVLNSSNLKIWFSEPMHFNVLSNLKAFNIASTHVSPVSIVASTNLFTELELQFAQNFVPGEKYTLKIENSITDICLNSLQEPAEYPFELPKIPQIGEVIINELLFNPIPESCDFIELFNNSQKTFDLANLFFA
ncbi:MAG TPA: hypothetical protein DCQ31_13455, partial [Bacteroidales bacterium]|nr:hypothetical protein [Bacteroidales bacterium]